MRDPKECKLYKNGRCQKVYGGCECTPSAADWFDERLDRCEVNETCLNSSTYGNDYFYITDEDIEALKAGKVLWARAEYGTFIAYRSKVDSGC